MPARASAGAPIPVPPHGPGQPVVPEPAAGDVPDAVEPVPPGLVPRWRAGEEDWRDEDATFADLMGAGADIGALDERDRPLDEQYLTFEDLEVPRADMPSIAPRGSADDPVFLLRTGAVVAVAGSDEPEPPGDGGAELPRPARRRSRGGRRRRAIDATATPAASGPGEVTGPGDTGAGSVPPDPGNTPGPGRDRSQAIVVGLTIAVAALGVFLLGAATPLRWLPLVLVVPAIVGAMLELFNAAERAGYKPVKVIGVAAGAVSPLAAYLAGSPAAPAGEAGIVAVLSASLAVCMAWYLFGAGKGRVVPNIAVTVLGIVYVGILGSYSALILRAGPWPGTASTVDQGIPLIILVIVGTEIYNAGGYLLGSRLGRTPLSSASPSKTREGLVLGMACAIGAIVVTGGVLGVGVRDMREALILAAVVAVVAPLGDLFESMLKRDLGVKDMSHLIPSHGGLLDRVDALLFALPASYYALRLLGVI